MKRRTFLVSAAALAGRGLLLPVNSPALTFSSAPEEPAFDPDPQGYYVACGLQPDGRFHLTELLNNRAVQHLELAGDDIRGVMEFLRQTGLTRARFIDWNAAAENVAVHEIEFGREGIGNVSDHELEMEIRACVDRLSSATCRERPDRETQAESELEVIEGEAEAMPSSITEPSDFDALEDVDLTSEAHFDRAVERYGGQRTTSVLGPNITHHNADWVFCDRQVVAEHKQLEVDVRASKAFARRELELRLGWARSGKANIFGVPKDWSTVQREWLRLYKPTVEGIIKKANKQIRATRERLGWPRGSGILIFSNKSVLEIYPLGMCLLIQSILDHACTEIGGAIYVTNHYLDIAGSDLANIGWFPIYRNGGEETPVEMIEFVDGFGRAFFETLDEIAPAAEPRREIPLQSPDAAAVLTAKAIVPRSRR